MALLVILAVVAGVAGFVLRAWWLVVVAPVVVLAVSLALSGADDGPDAALQALGAVLVGLVAAAGVALGRGTSGSRTG